MANIKLPNDNWETSGIYDIGQSKTQRVINSEVNTKIGNTTMGTTATTLTGAIAEHEGDISSLNGAINDVAQNKFNGKKILMIGDSWSAGWTGSQGGDGWMEYLTPLLQCTPTKIKQSGAGFVQKSITNSTYPNETFIEVLEHVKTNTYDFIIVQGGVNDIHNATSTGQINTAMLTFKTNCATYFPNVPVYYFPTWARAYIPQAKNQYGRALVQFASQYGYIFPANGFNWFIGFVTTQGTDTNHLSTYGYEILANNMYRFMQMGYVEPIASVLSNSDSWNVFTEISTVGTYGTTNGYEVKSYKENVYVSVQYTFSQNPSSTNIPLLNGIPSANLEQIMTIPNFDGIDCFCYASSAGQLRFCRESTSGTNNVNGKTINIRYCYKTIQNYY